MHDGVTARETMSETDALLDLCILSTTDLHMHLLSYDYFSNRCCDQVGLAQIASLIISKQAEVKNSLLFDNGDFFQGNPLGDYLAASNLTKNHPAIVAMNNLGYDAATIGNHDFNFGYDFLTQILQDAAFSFVASNLKVTKGADLCPPWLILTKKVFDRNGQDHIIRIGLAGFLPPQTVDWDRDLKGVVEVEDIVEAARKVIPVLRENGADLIIALAHSGLGEVKPRRGMENAAGALAGLAGIDAVVAGHTHMVFPSPHFPPSPEIDPIRGAVWGKPLVMAGFFGSHLGVMDLVLRKDEERWQIDDFTVTAMPAKESPPSHFVTDPAQASHRATMAYFDREVGQTSAPIHSFFSLLGHDAGSRLLADAKSAAILRARPEFGKTPFLTAVSSFRAGGRGGPLQYSHIDAGKIRLRDIADLYLFNNRICAVQMTGAMVHDWLERSASLFHQVMPGQAHQPLIDPHFPAYLFDTLYGLTYEIDLTKPPGYYLNGTRRSDQNRVGNIRYQSRPLGAEEFITIATNSYRISTTGLYGPLMAKAQIVYDERDQVRDLLQHHVERQKIVHPNPMPVWRFAPCLNTSVIFPTAPQSLHYLAELEMDIDPIGQNADGFLEYSLML